MKGVNLYKRVEGERATWLLVGVTEGKLTGRILKLSGWVYVGLETWFTDIKETGERAEEVFGLTAQANVPGEKIPKCVRRPFVTENGVLWAWVSEDMEEVSGCDS